MKRSEMKDSETNHEILHMRLRITLLYMSDRMLKINELILQRLGEVITREVEMPNVIVTITRVTTSKDLHYSTIYVSVLPDDKLDFAIKKLNSVSKHLRYELNKKIILRVVPQLEFRPDTSERQAQDIDKLLDSLRE